MARIALKNTALEGYQKMSVIRTVEEKKAELKQREEYKKRLSKAVDKMVADRIDAEHGREVGCSGPGLCPALGRGVARFLGLSRVAGSVSVVDQSVRSSAPCTSSSSVSSRVFGAQISKKQTNANAPRDRARGTERRASAPNEQIGAANGGCAGVLRAGVPTQRGHRGHNNR